MQGSEADLEFLSEGRRGEDEGGYLAEAYCYCLVVDVVTTEDVLKAARKRVDLSGSSEYAPLVVRSQREDLPCVALAVEELHEGAICHRMG